MVGWLADGTPHYAPVGCMLADGDQVCCHLCGRWFLSVASHLSVHGWTKADYIAAFGLERGNPLSGEATHKRRSAALTARQAVDPAIQRAQAEGSARSRSGALTAAATTAARGRPHPAERRVKTLATLSGISAQARAEGSRRWAERHREQIAAGVAARFGFDTFAAYLLDRLGRGMSMAAISREAGLHKDWVSRQLPAIAPQIARARHTVQPHRSDVRLRPVARRLGFPDAETYLRTAHVEQHRCVAAIAAEAGVSRWTILAALRHHGIQPVPHAAKRHHAAHRSHTVAESLGFDSLASYIAERRAHGVTWKSLVAESGLAETTLRRHAGL
jgi:lambda repressor-like predicted transcriptional regulator